MKIWPILKQNLTSLPLSRHEMLIGGSFLMIWGFLIAASGLPFEGNPLEIMARVFLLIVPSLFGLLGVFMFFLALLGMGHYGKARTKETLKKYQETPSERIVQHAINIVGWTVIGFIPALLFLYFVMPYVFILLYAVGLLPESTIDAYRQFLYNLPGYLGV